MVLYYKRHWEEAVYMTMSITMTQEELDKRLREAFEDGYKLGFEEGAEEGGIGMARYLEDNKEQE